MSAGGESALWGHALELFQSAVELPDDERPAFLDAACRDDPEVRRRVDALLAADGRDESLGGGAGERFQRLLGGEPRTPVAAEWMGRRFGPFRVVGELGEGGMGTVFLAERCDGQFAQRVALKVARSGFASDEMRQRLLAERQILAGLEHPHIARLLDGGVSDEGIPFFAMEYVEGRPITAFCAAEELDVEARLRLFLDVCAAVEHAHRNLIVHRDLKPSNILVTVRGEVKLLDFGIAKLLAGEGFATTATLHQVLTPAYAAPEQIRGEPVTTATDVYALGVVLFELLVGRRPFAASGDQAAAALAAAVLGTAPAKPSTAIAEAAPAAPLSPRARRLRRRLRGDLDTIVLTALQKEPGRRYPSAAAVAEDLRLHLGGLPIKARPDTLRYRTVKFARRHRVAVAGSIVLLAALVAALGVAVGQARAKAREARASQEVTSFLVGLFEGSDPALSRGAALTAQELLEQGAARLRTDLGAQPATRARLLRTIAATFVALGLYDRALPLAEEALRLRRAGAPGGDPDVADSLDQNGQILRLKADYGRAEPLLREALALRRQAFGERAPEVAASLGSLGALLHDRGEFKAADADFRQALAIAERAHGANAIETAARLQDLAGNLQDMGHPADAVALLRRALAIRERRQGADHPDVASTLHDLGADLETMFDYAGAEASLGRALAIRKKVFGPGHPLAGSTELALGDLYDGMERYDDAERATRHALAVLRQALGDDHPKVTEALNMLAVLEARRRRFASAVPLLRQVLARNTRALGASHPDTLAVENSLAFLLLRTGELAESERLHRSVLAAARSDNGQGVLILNRLNLAGTLQAEGRAVESIELARQAVAWQRRLFGERRPDLAMAIRQLAVAEELGGQPARAEADFRQALAIAESLGPAGKDAAAGSALALADFLVATHRPAAALPLLAGAVAQLQAGHDPDPLWRREADLLMGRCLALGGDAGGEAREEAARRALAQIPAADVDLFPAARALLRQSHGPMPLPH